MDEEKKAAQTGEETPKKQNWVTDIYDKMNVSVRTLDIMLVVLVALVVFLFIFGNQIKLG